MSEFKLCYVKEPWAFFTTQDIKNQWGDDWNDAPYEHNAGEPYEANKERGEEWGITKVSFEGPLYTPDHNCQNSGWAVKEINAGQIPWLRTDKWFKGEPINIFAGETLKMFITKVVLVGGKVYFEYELPGGPDWYHKDFVDRLKAHNEKLRSLIAPGLERMKLINGHDLNCVRPTDCANHKWIKDAEEALKGGKDEI